MKYYKVIDNGIITMIGSGSAIHETQTEIVNDIDENGKEIEGSAEKKYYSLLEVIQDKPEDTFESVYYLDAETETYLPRERTHDEIIDWYVTVVTIGTVELADVPEEYRTEVEAKLPQPEPDEEQKVVDSIMQEVSGYGY